jgi:hypothetical protein
LKLAVWPQKFGADRLPNLVVAAPAANIQDFSHRHAMLYDESDFIVKHKFVAIDFLAKECPSLVRLAFVE